MLFLMYAWYLKNIKPRIIPNVLYFWGNTFLPITVGRIKFFDASRQKKTFEEVSFTLYIILFENIIKKVGKIQREK